MKKSLSVLFTVIATALFGQIASAQNINEIIVGDSIKAEFGTVKEALSSISFTPDENNYVTIRLEDGSFKEDVKIDIPYVRLCGAGEKKTSLSGKDSYAVYVTENAMGFELESISLEGEKALYCESGSAVISGASIVGDKESVRVENKDGRVVLKDCRILGSECLVLGSGTLWAEDCYLTLKNNKAKFTDCTNEANMGFVFNSCGFDLGNIKGEATRETKVVVSDAFAKRYGKTALPQVKEHSLSQKEVLNPLDTVTLGYSYSLATDTKLDCALISWYRVDKKGKETFVKCGISGEALNYTLSEKDLGYKIKAKLYPFTYSSLSKKAEMIETVTTAEVTKKVSTVRAKDKIRIYLAGDSTVKSYGDDNTIGGWGEYLPEYFSEKVEIINKAEGGRSTRSFINQGRLDEILNEIRKGDYLFIQFGHNDGLTTENARVEHSVFMGVADENGIYPTIEGKKTPTPERIIEFYKNDEYSYGDEFYPYESGSYKWYLKQYIEGAKKKGAIPVLITPVSRVFFDENGKITSHHGENDEYVTAAIQAANESGCLYIDMFDITKSLYESYGINVSQGIQNIKADGTMDLTHYNKFGANIVASKLAEAIKNKGLTISGYVQSSTKYVGKTDGLKTAKLFIIGGSQCAEYEQDNGYLISKGGLFNDVSKYIDSKIEVVNLAKENLGLKKFKASEGYQRMLNEVGEGDYVFVCFGENEWSVLTSDYTQLNSELPRTQVDKGFESIFYNDYIKPILDRKAHPIVITPIYDKVNGEKKRKYSEAIKSVVVDKQLYFMDLFTASEQLYTDMGEDGSVVLNPLSMADGLDRSALSDFGAETMTKKVISSLKFSSATFKDYIIDANLSQTEAFTKAEYIEAVIRLLEEKKGIKANTTYNFVDVDLGKEYADAIAKAKALGIAEDDENGLFNPESALTGPQLKSISANAMYCVRLNKGHISEIINRNDETISREVGLWAINKLYNVLS